jgi:uncharacterized protein (TIGR03083 family)
VRIDDYIAALRTEGELLTHALRRTYLAKDLDTVSPGCPEWTVRELAHHTGRVHRWAASYVRDRRPRAMTSEEEELTWGTMPEDSGLVEWFADGHSRLVEVLSNSPADLACWSFFPAPSPLAFWARRQAHETAIHRVDAELAVTAVSAVPVEFAVDGIDELLLCFFSRRRNRLRFDEPKTLSVMATDADASWLVHIGPEGASAERCDAAVAEGQADATFAGPAPALYLELWNRPTLALRDSESGSGAPVVATGDAAVVDLWRQKARVTWS